ncbi:MAG: CapA family protein [Cyclobacteriaceae bacterium]|nr:CapA family protein [Cyclobacteriaceae bacterium]
MKKLLVIFLLFTSLVLPAQDTLRTSLLFVGDIMQHDSQISAAYQPDSARYDYKPCFEFIKPLLSAPDLTIGNLELTLAGPPYKGFPQFSAPDELLTALKDAGFDVLVTANNHCVDRGRRGLERTIDLLDSANLLHTGTFKDTLDWLNNYPLRLESKGISFSLLNYTYGTNGLPVHVPNLVNRIDTSRIRLDLQKAQLQKTDAIIVFMHWGEEYKSLPNQTQKMLAQFCFNHGAQLVIGAHPHVLQPIEWDTDKNQLVAWSLGNFVSGQRDRYKNGGALLHIDMEKVVHADSNHSVRIKQADYSLDWVYRANDKRRTYRILPVPAFESDTVVVREPAAREALLRFRDDSRMLFDKHNKNVRERVLPKDQP